MFSHSDSEATDEVYLEGLDEIRLYFKAKGIRIKDQIRIRIRKGSS